MPLFGKKGASKVTHLFFATDVHGSERTYRKFLNAGKFYNADVLVMGGDIIGKLMIPIIQEGNGHYRATLQGSVEHLTTQDELKAILEKIGILGFYSKIMEEDEYKTLAADKAAVDATFHDLARRRLQSWVELADTRLAGTGITCYVTGGNDDYPDVLDVLKQGTSQAIIDCEGQAIQVDDQHTMISVGNSTPTPWNTPREMSDEDLGKVIDGMISQVSDMSRCIFNFHDPPSDSTLDTCPQLDWSTDPPTPIVKAGQMVMYGAGSHSVRKAIETRQPMLGLHGHIHESSAVAKIGRTLCVNPGSEYGEGVLRGALINMNAGEVESYQLTSG